MEQVADEKNRIDQQIAVETQKGLAELSRRDLNVLKKAQSGQEVAHLTNSASVYKKQLSELVGKYAAVQGALTKEIASQENTLTEMGTQFKQREAEIQKLMEVKQKQIEVNDLHREVDKENALNINQKIHELIDTLISMDKKRREAQNLLENAQENWQTKKLKLFEDEASRQSRQNAIDKASKAVEDLINKLRNLDKTKNDVEAIKEDLENKIQVDGILDEVREGLNRELDSTNLKI